jgi:hypothetical protein
LLDHAVKGEFVRPVNLKLVQVAKDSAELCNGLEQQLDRASPIKKFDAQGPGALKP